MSDERGRTHYMEQPASSMPAELADLEAWDIADKAKRHPSILTPEQEDLKRRLATLLDMSRELVGAVEAGLPREELLVWARRADQARQWYETASATIGRKAADATASIPKVVQVQ